MRRVKRSLDDDDDSDQGRPPNPKSLGNKLRRRELDSYMPVGSGMDDFVSVLSGLSGERKDKSL